MNVDPASYKDLQDKADAVAKAILKKRGQSEDKDAFWNEGMNREAYDLANVCSSLARENEEMARQIVAIKQMIDGLDRSVYFATGQHLGSGRGG